LKGLLKINRALQARTFRHILKGGVNVINDAARGHQIFHFKQPIGDQFELRDGITVISTDFIALGKRAAQYVRNPVKTHEMIPTRLIVRNSL